MVYETQTIFKHQSVYFAEGLQYLYDIPCLSWLFKYKWRDAIDSLNGVNVYYNGRASATKSRNKNAEYNIGLMVGYENNSL